MELEKQIQEKLLRKEEQMKKIKQDELKDRIRLQIQQQQLFYEQAREKGLTPEETVK